MPLKSPHILLAGRNARQVKTNLSHILDAAGQAAIEQEIVVNATQLFRLGETHYTFARRLAPPDWRQVVSRAYYGAYNICRSVRFFHSGEYSTDAKDHHKFDQLPEDFPQRSTYSNQLAILREDRNLCDYDHTASEADLVIGRRDALILVEQFIADANTYLAARGLAV
jgi:hypothetical protein